MNIASEFSILSILQGIHRATYYQSLSESSFEDGVQFLELIATKHSHLLTKRCVQKAMEYGLKQAVRYNRIHILEYLKNSTLLSLLRKKVLINVFAYSILLHHKNYDLTLALLEQHAPELLEHKKIKQAIHRSALRAQKWKRKAIYDALVEFS